LHAKNLDIGSDGFPPFETNVPSGIRRAVLQPVALKEPANVLALLFSYLYPERIRETFGIDFETLLALTEAAEKYQVHLAIRECKKQLRYLPFLAHSFWVGSQQNS
jgi:hypothetical protein